jgi:hypothetical protein
VKSEEPARLTLIGIGGYGAGNRIKEFKVLNKINQKQKTKKTKNTKNLSMKEKQKHRQSKRSRSPIVGNRMYQKSSRKGVPAAGRFAPSSRLILP